MDFDLQALMVFRDLAKSGNFSRTGRTLGLSQPAVSQTISQLENAVGLVLLERGATGARLTPAGSAFLARASEVCEAFSSFMDNTARLGRQLDGEVSVGVDASSHARTVARKFSGDGCVRMETVGDRWNEDLEAGRVDVVIASRFLQEGMTAGLQEALLKTERGITLAWHPAFHSFDTENFNFPEVLRTTLLIPDNASARGFGSFIEQWCDHAYGMRGANTVHFENEIEAARAADAGLGVYLAPGDAMDRLGGLAHDLSFVRTFEFLLPEAYKVGIYCRADERVKEVVRTAAEIVKAGRKCFS